MKSEEELVLELIKEVGIKRLGNWDGCACSWFSVRNVNVDISCGKGGDRGIWVHSRSMDYDDSELLRPIAEEVKCQVEQSDRRGPIQFYLHEWHARGSNIVK